MGEPVLHHTVDSSVVFSPKRLLQQKPTRELHGSSLVLPTPMLFSTMMNGKLLRRPTLTNSDLTMPFHVSKKTRREERCTSKTRLRNTLTKSSPSLRTVPTSTSVVLRE